MTETFMRDPWEGTRDELRRRILDGTLRPGERILEMPLAEGFGVSRGPVREAIRALEAEGLIVRKPRFGSIVVPIDARSADEMYSLRRVLEPFAVERALDRRPDELQMRLWIALGDMKTALRDGRTVVDADIAFHGTFIECADHHHLEQIWKSMVGPLRIMIGLTSRRAPEDFERTRLGHEEIYRAVEAHDLDTATDALRDHLDLANAMILKALAEASTPDDSH